MTYHAIGDSITFCTAATDAAHGYVALLAVALSLGSPVNHGVSGDMALDATTKVQSITPSAADKYTIMLGVNDERIYGANTTRQGYFHRALQAQIAYLATGTKQMPRTSGVYTGVWGNTTVNAIGRNSNTNGSTATFNVSGTALYIAMIQQEVATGTADIFIDGTKVDNVTSAAVGVTTLNGASYGAMLKRYSGLAPGAHSVQIVVTSPTGGPTFTYIDWVAGSDQTIKPSVYVGNVLRSTGYSTGGSDANVASYNSDIAAIVAEFAADGLNVTLVDVSSAVNQTTDLASDGYHPVNSGHAKIEAAFYAAMIGALPPTYNPAIIEMDVLGNFFGRLSTDTAGTSRKQLN